MIESPEEQAIAPLTFDTLPSMAAPPRGSVVPRSHRRRRSRLARREFLRFAGTALIGTGLAFAGLFPTARRAMAHHAVDCWEHAQYCTNPSQSTHSACGTSSSNVATAHCAPTGWHRHDNVAAGASHYYQYTLERRCGNASVGYKWAWRWNTWRCADGRRRLCNINTGSCGSWSPTVCPWNNTNCSTLN